MKKKSNIIKIGRNRKKQMSVSKQRAKVLEELEKIRKNKNKEV